jgi:hypothetical protein
VSFGVSEPLHRWRIDTHGWFANNFRSSGMQAKPLLPSRRTILLPCASVSMIRANLETLSGPADIARAIFSCVVSPAIADTPLCEVCDSARPTNLTPIIRSRASAVMALAKNLRLELSDLMSPPGDVSPVLCPPMAPSRFLARPRAKAPRLRVRIRLVANRPTHPIVMGCLQT